MSDQNQPSDLTDTVDAGNPDSETVGETERCVDANFPTSVLNFEANYLLADCRGKQQKVRNDQRIVTRCRWFKRE